MPGLVRPVTDERDGLLAYLDQQRHVAQIAAYGLTDEQARATPTPSALSVGGLIKHLAHVERQWIATLQERDRGDYEAYAASFRMALESPDQFRAVDLRTLAPIYVHATANELNDDARQEFWAVVAVDGRIAGVGQNVVQFAGPPLGVHSLVAPQYLHDGDNDVRLYLVEPHGGAVTLRPLTP